MAYWRDLQRSLTDRADALREYVDALLVDSARSDDGFTRALKMCRLYTGVFVDALEADIEGTTDATERTEFAKGHLNDFMTRYAYIDRWLSRGSQSAVPRALNTICRRQFEAAAITGHEPVLTVGAPDSFEVARIPDLYEFLFAGLHSPTPQRREEVGELTDGKSLAIISVPYIEGTRTLWYPITVGHELCHLRLASTPAGVDLARLMEHWVNRDGVKESEAWKALRRREPRRSARATLLTALESWSMEIVCDLNAVRLFGPAGFSAITEFISLSDHPDEVSASSTHPPARLRLEVMLRYLAELGFASDEVNHPVGAPWSAPPPEGHAEDPVTAWLEETLLAGAEELIAQLQSWGFRLRNDTTFKQVVERCVEDLLDGIPCSTHVLLDSADWIPVSVAAVVNAAWQAREELGAGSDEAAAAGPRRVLQRAPGLPPEERRLQVDRLAGKAIDSIELARLWEKHSGLSRNGAEVVDESRIVAPGELEAGDPLDPAQPTNGAGVLSCRRIVARLNEEVDDPSRLIVAPLFLDAVREAGVDLRLGPDFIVFRHSSTAAFDPLASTHDPRMVQERVTKSWGERFILHPNELVLAATLEYLVVPSDLSGQVITRSSYGRLGLMTATAVQIQPGSRGCITLELQNQGETPIALWPGARVAQLILWSITDPVEAPPAKYWFPVGPEFSKAHVDADVGKLAELGRRRRDGRQGQDGKLEVRFSASGRVRDYFAQTEQSQRDSVPVDIDRPGPADLGRSSHHDFSANRARLVEVLRKWGAAQDRGVVVSQDGRPGSLTIRTSPGNEKVVEFLHPNGERRTASNADPVAIRTELDRLVTDADLPTPADMPV